MLSITLPLDSSHTDADASSQNLVRQSLYYNYDYYHNLGTGAFSNKDHIVRKHVCKSTPAFIRAHLHLFQKKKNKKG